MFRQACTHARVRCFAHYTLCFHILVFAFLARIKELLMVPFYSHSLGCVNMEASLSTAPRKEPGGLPV